MISDSAMATHMVPAYLWEYATRFDSLLEAAHSLDRHLKHMLDESSIVPFSIDARAKSLESYQRKAEQTPGGVLKYRVPHRDITDCIAARIITFSADDKERVCQVIRDELKPCEDNDPGQQKQNGYSSRHFLVGPGAWNERLASLSKYYARHPALEIQVRTVAEHAWAEYEHHVRFKPVGEGAYNSVAPDVQKRIDHLLTVASGQRDAMDKNFAEIEQILRPAPTPTEEQTRPSPTTAEPVSPQPDALSATSFQEWLNRRYPASLPSGEGAVDWMLDVLKALNLNSETRLDEALADVDSESVAALIEYRFAPGQIRRLDDDLLAALGPDYIAANELVDSDEPNRPRILLWRWGRLNGKLRIYSFTGGSAPADIKAKSLSASGAFREAIRLVVDSTGDSRDAFIEGVVSPHRDLPPTARPVPLNTSTGTLWVHANLSRQLAEGHVVELLGRLPAGFVVEFRRAGEIVWPVQSVQVL